MVRRTILAAALCCALALPADGQHGGELQGTRSARPSKFVGTHAIARAPAALDICNVLQHGAKGDGVAEDTAAVAAAFGACTGGTVLLPAGYRFLLRPVELPSATHIRIEGDVLAWTDMHSWPNSTVRRCPISPYGTPHDERVYANKKESLFWTVNSTNVHISGTGTIIGGGDQWWKMYASTGSGYWHNCRPSLLEFGIGLAYGPKYPATPNSGITVTGITLKDSPFWTFVARGVDGMVVDGVTITTPPCDAGGPSGYMSAPNTDGFNVQGHDILIANSYVRNRDDCVPIFPPSSNIRVRNITCECGNGLVPCIWPAGGPGAGGDIVNVSFEGARFVRSSMAVAIKSLPGFDGEARNISYRDVVLEDVGQAVMLNVFAQQWQGQSRAALASAAAAPGKEGTTRFADVTVTNVTGTVFSPGKITCAAGDACNGIRMQDVMLTVLPGTGTGKRGASKNYTCANAHGTAQNCSPAVCLTPASPEPLSNPTP